MQDKQIQDEGNQEYISAETVQNIVVDIYKSALRFQHHVEHIFSWQDARFTLKALLLSVVALIFAWIVGDALFLMITANIYMLLPLIEKKKPREYEKLNAVINK